VRLDFGIWNIKEHHNFQRSV